MTAIQEAARAFSAADVAWSHELRRIYRRAAGDVRYTKTGEGQPGSKLRELFDEFKSTGDTWRALASKEHLYQ